MLHTKFRGNLPAGSGEEVFLKGFTIYWDGSHLGHVTSIMSIKIWLKTAQWHLRKAGFNFHM